MALPLPKLTPERYLAIEREADYKSEYYNGEMFAMAGGTGKHADLSGCLNWIFRNRLAGRPCKVYTPICAYAPGTMAFIHTRTSASSAVNRSSALTGKIGRASCRERV